MAAGCVLAAGGACLLFDYAAIHACRRLLVEVAERGLVKFGAHKVQMGKFLLQAAREFAR